MMTFFFALLVYFKTIKKIDDLPKIKQAN